MEATNLTPMERIIQFKKKVTEGTLTASELKEHWEYAINNESEIIVGVITRMGEQDNWKKKRQKTKEEGAKNYYNRHLEEIAYAVVEVFSYEHDFTGKKNNKLIAIQKIVESATDEMLQAMFEKTNVRKQERETIIEQHKKAIDNPETLEEFRIKLRYNKALLPEEQEKYDELLALARKAKKLENKEEKIVVASNVLDSNMFILKEDVDTRDSSKLWVASLLQRLGKEEFDTVKKQMSALGGYWSNFKKGFIFKSNPVGAEAEAEATEKVNSKSDKLRKVAVNMQAEIDNLRKDRLVNTARRASMASSAEYQADKLENLQQTIINLADALDNGELKFLDSLDSKAQVETLEHVLTLAKHAYEKANNIDYLQSKERCVELIDIRYAEMPATMLNADHLRYIIKDMRDKDGFKMICKKFEKLIAEAEEGKLINLTKYTDELDKLIKNGDTVSGGYLEESLAERKRLMRLGIQDIGDLRAYLREYYQYRSQRVATKQDMIKQMERELVGTTIEGYFPTPYDLVDRMMEIADIKEGMKVLEPSAGKGNIADRIPQEAELSVIEWSYTLRNILSTKGYNIVGEDFLQHSGLSYDRIVMNPPFENLQDAEHVKHAYSLLANNGKLVAIMSESPFFRTDKKAVEFREWLENIGGTSEKLPDGSFKSSERSTGVATRLVVIDKAQHEAKLLLENNQQSVKIEADSTEANNDVIVMQYSYTNTTKDGYVVKKDGQLSMF